MEISSQSKLLDVLSAYPFLEAQIMNIAPPFKNLTNPVLRRTVGKLATIEMVAKVGGLDVDRLVDTLRQAAGQPALEANPVPVLLTSIPRSADDAQWIAGQPQFTLDGTALLARGEVPLAKVNELLRQLEPGRFLLLVTHFEPTPILDALQKQGRRVLHKPPPEGETQHWTFIG